SMLLAAFAFIAQAPAPAAGTVQGIVCERETCKPISGARLAIAIPSNPGSRRTTVTDFAGTFRFTQLPPGTYQIYPVEADNYAGEGFPRLITLTERVGVDNVKIEMRPLGTISGHVFDEAGAPLVDARVEALLLPLNIPYQRYTPVTSAQTDDHGEYRLS